MTIAILIGVLVLPWLVARLSGASEHRRTQAGVIGVALLFTLTGLGHFFLAEPMADMIPPFLPGRLAAVYGSGVVEMVLAALVLYRPLRRWAGWTMIVLAVLFLPINIYGAFQRVPLGGHDWGPLYLLIRVPMQAMLIGWIYWFVVRNVNVSSMGNRSFELADSE